MHRELLIVLTIASIGAGWCMGRLVHHKRSGTVTASNDGGSAGTTPVPSPKEVIRSTEQALDAHALFTRMKAEVGAEHLGVERAPMLFAELKDLPNDQFLSVIANLSAEKNWFGSDLARLLVGYWAERDLPAARQWVLGLGEKANINFVDSFFETWSRMDVAGMFDWLENHADELTVKTVRSRTTYNAAKAAWRLDPERGIRLVKLLDPKAGSLWNLYQQWAEHDPKAASARLLQEPDAKIREHAMSGLVSAWAPLDPTAAKTWAESIPDPVVSAKMVAYVGSVIGWNDPHAGAEYLVQIPQTNDTREALKGTIESWADRDSKAALEWVAEMENTSVGDWIAAEVMKKMSAEDRKKAEEHWSSLREAARAEKGQ